MAFNFLFPNKNTNKITPSDTNSIRVDTAYNRRRFLQCAKQGDLESVSEMIEMGVTPNFQDAEGRSSLLVAVESKNVELARLLVNCIGINANLRYKETNATPLIFAAKNLDPGPDRLNIVKLLLQIQGIDIDSQDKEGYTALAYAALFGDVHLVHLLVESNAEVNLGRLIIPQNQSATQDIKCVTALHYAKNGGFEEIISYLESKGAKEYITKDEWQTLMDKNLVRRDTVARLKRRPTRSLGPSQTSEYKVDRIVLSNTNSDSQDNRHELIESVRSEDPLKLSNLIKLGVNPNCRDEIGMTPLIMAVDKSRPDLVRIILSSPKVDVNFPDGDTGTTPLIAAAKQFGEKRLEVLNLLLHATGVNINAQDKEGQTAIIFASLFGDYDVVKLLIDMGADIQLGTIAPGNGDKVETPLYYAKLNSHDNVIALLKSHGGEEYAAVTAKRKRAFARNVKVDRPALSMIATAPSINNENSNTGTSRTSRNRSSSWDGSSQRLSNSKDRTNDTTSSSSSSDILQIKKITIPNPAKSDTSWNRTMLLLNVKKGDVKAVESLIEKGVDPNYIDEEGNTALLSAISSQNFEIVKLLLSSPKINVNLKGDGKSGLLDPTTTTTSSSSDTSSSKSGGNKTPHPLHFVTSLIVNNISTNKPNEQLMSIISVILQETGINVNIQDDTFNNNETPLCISTRGGDDAYGLCKLLYSYNADVNLGSNGPSTSPLVIAKGASYQKLVDLYTNQPPPNPLKKLQQHHHQQQKSSDSSTTSKTGGSQNSVIGIIASGPSAPVPKADTNYNRSKLFLSVKKGSSDEVKRLLGRGVSPNFIDDQVGKTPLAVAVESRNLEIIKLLLYTPYIDVNLRKEETMDFDSDDRLQSLSNDSQPPPNNSFTPLMLASSIPTTEKSSKQTIISLLLETPGINIQLTNKFGDTAIKIAEKLGDTSTVTAISTVNTVTPRVLIPTETSNATSKSDQSTDKSDSSNQPDKPNNSNDDLLLLLPKQKGPRKKKLKRNLSAPDQNKITLKGDILKQPDLGATLTSNKENKELDLSDPNKTRESKFQGQRPSMSSRSGRASLIGGARIGDERRESKSKVQKDADDGKKNADTNWNRSKLQLNVKKGDVRAVETLIKKGVSPNFVDDDGLTPIFVAIDLNNTTLLKVLLSSPKININYCEEGNGNNNSANTAGVTPLIYAVQKLKGSNRNDTVKLLIAVDNIDVNIQDDAGHTALVYAAKSDDPQNYELCTMLLDAGADASIGKTTVDFTQTPLFFAEQRGDQKLIDLFKKSQDKVVKSNPSELSKETELRKVLINLQSSSSSNLIVSPVTLSSANAALSRDKSNSKSSPSSPTSPASPQNDSYTSRMSTLPSSSVLTNPNASILALPEFAEKLYVRVTIHDPITNEVIGKGWKKFLYRSQGTNYKTLKCYDVVNMQGTVTDYSSSYEKPELEIDFMKMTSEEDIRVSEIMSEPMRFVFAIYPLKLFFASTSQKGRDLWIFILKRMFKHIRNVPLTSASQKRISAATVDSTTKKELLYSHIEEGRKQKAIELLNTGINPNFLIDGKSLLGHTILSIPTYSVQPSSTNNNNHTSNTSKARTSLSENSNYEILSLLLSNPILDVNIVNRMDGSTPIIVAAKLPYPKIRKDVVAMLLKHPRISVNAREVTGGGRTALVYAATWGDVDLCKLLLDYGADVNLGRESVSGIQTPLFYAKSGRHTAVIQLLRSHGAVEDEDEKDKDPNASDYFPRASRALLMRQSQIYPDRSNDNDDLFMESVQNSDIRGTAELIKKGFSTNFKDKRTGLPPLAVATQRGDKNMLRLLLMSRVIDVNIQDSKKGRSALHYATLYKPSSNYVSNSPSRPNNDGALTTNTDNASTTRLDMVKLLLTVKNVNVNIRDKNGYTALCFATKKGDVQIVKSLLKARADVNLGGTVSVNKNETIVEYDEGTTPSLLLHNTSSPNNAVVETPLIIAKQENNKVLVKLFKAIIDGVSSSHDDSSDAKSLKVPSSSEPSLSSPQIPTISSKYHSAGSTTLQRSITQKEPTSTTSTTSTTDTITKSNSGTNVTSPRSNRTMLSKSVTLTSSSAVHRNKPNTTNTTANNTTTTTTTRGTTNLSSSTGPVSKNITTTTTTTSSTPKNYPPTTNNSNVSSSPPKSRTTTPTSLSSPSLPKIIDDSDIELKNKLLAYVKKSDLPNVAELIKSGVDTSYMNANGESSIHLAVLASDAKMLRLLMASSRLNVNIQTNDTKRTALMLAILLKQPSNIKVGIVNILLQSKSINLDIADSTGFTALHHVVSEGDKSICQILLNAGANIKVGPLRDGKMLTPLHHAVLINKNELTETIKSHVLEKQKVQQSPVKPPSQSQQVANQQSAQNKNKTSNTTTSTSQPSLPTSPTSPTPSQINASNTRNVRRGIDGIRGGELQRSISEKMRQTITRSDTSNGNSNKN
eukprot:TRINITY_DN1081_c0_g1_i1.p1 TRINITY_DN1081_c0_g1~~TRINITY_DN1081_c0_g1_i1.p1  ORF type:complete len:2429 (-),score=667.42 TRINITY_DN1081_c0_g1_i1:82-7368(-)